jgi:hypothetical protein
MLEMHGTASRARGSRRHVRSACYAVGGCSSLIAGPPQFTQREATLPGHSFSVNRDRRVSAYFAPKWLDRPSAAFDFDLYGAEIRDGRITLTRCESASHHWTACKQQVMS